ncbi:MAG TPA: hypothetical protein VII72_13950 [Myxococcota bacterium]|jgi:hypothetical protein
MRSGTTPNPYEVYCTRCNVSFPVGTRVCMHCGQPIGRAASAPRALGGPGPFDEEPAEEPPARSVAFSPMTFVWLLAAAATVIYRSCQQP